MNFDVVTTVEPDLVRLTVTGEYEFDRMFAFIDFVRSEADKAHRHKVLIDCRGLHGNMTEADRFQSGKQVAHVFGSRIHAAVVMPVGQVTKLGELAAVNRGAKLLVTESISEAIDWLQLP